ncbi:MAG: insulinase family protein [Saprospiraceae bacterium]|nr:insulinase family protein [Saprospiraceae bacterium]
MIRYNQFELENGLRVIVHEDSSTPFVVVNVIYDVGARDESPERTGFAHLFEHLMFGGSKHVPEFDKPLELAGAKNNAFTNNDVTNYYDIIPKENLDTALWLESDRMGYLNIDQHALDVQRKVVVEEFKERYLTKPYGEVWHHLRQMAYTTHPYQWPTIGLTTKHIEEAELEDVRAFFEKHYNPSNAILLLAGNITEAEARDKATTWFGDLSPGQKYVRDLPQEPEQTAARRKVVKADVPLDALYMAFPMPARNEAGYYECDLISDVLSNGHSSRLYRSLVKEKQQFSSVHAYILGSFERGLFIIEGKPLPGISNEEAEGAIWSALHELVEQPPSERELQKVKNKVEANLVYQRMQPMNKALALAFSAIGGDVSEVNEEDAKYQAITVEGFTSVAKQLFRKEKSNTLWWLAESTAK